MKNMYKMMSAGAAIALAMGSQSAMAQLTDTATADAKVDIVTAIQIENKANLLFGKVAIPTTGAPTTVILTTAGVRSGTADTVGTQTTSVATFDVTGDSLAYTPAIKFLTAGTTGLSITNLVGKCSSQPDVTLTTDNTSTNLADCAMVSGKDTIKVGGTLSVGATAVAGGSTVGTMTVIVAYN